MLSEEQKMSWRDNGYLHIKNVLPPQYIEDLKGALEELSRKYGCGDLDAQFQIGLDKKFIVKEGDIFRDLIDCRYTFPYIVELMGPCIQLSMSHALIRPAGNDFEGFVHTDGGPSMQSVCLTEDSKPLQVKIQYFLTDVEAELSGNFIFKPGSHKIPFPAYGVDYLEEKKKMNQLVVKAGDVAIFPSSLWHGAIKNTSKNDRKSLIYGYSQIFLRPYDYNFAEEELLAKCDLRKRRLLGDMGVDKPQAHYYPPCDQVAVMEGVQDAIKEYE